MFIIAFIEVNQTRRMKLKILALSLVILFTISTTPIFAQSDELVILHTGSGKITIEFFPNDAPNHVNNFLDLTKNGFYDETVFHRIIEGFMIQGGDPLTKPGAFETFYQWGTGDPGYSIDEEFNDIKHNRGIVSMARSADPNSAGSQFFIVHEDSNFLDGQYTVFGRIVTQESFETLDKIADIETPAKIHPEIANTEQGATIPGDKAAAEIQKAEVVSRSEVSNLLELTEPERMSQSPDPIPDEEYSNDKLGFSATFPTGWLIQEPPKTQPNIPDVSAVGPALDGFNPAISVSVVETEGKTLEEKVDEIKDSLQISIDSGMMTIDTEEFTKVNGKDAHLMTATSNFQTSQGDMLIKFGEVVIKSSDKFFQITYVNLDRHFERQAPLFDNTVNSFKILSEDSSPTENGGGCLIATATYGTELSPQVQELRETRDNVLLKTESGKSFLTAFNQFYYSFSPTIADLERQNLLFKEIVKTGITPLLTSLSILNYVEINSEHEIVGYGISLILLNIGMYFAAPAYIFYRLRK